MRKILCRIKKLMISLVTNHRKHFPQVGEFFYVTANDGSKSPLDNGVFECVACDEYLVIGKSMVYEAISYRFRRASWTFIKGSKEVVNAVRRK